MRKCGLKEIRMKEACVRLRRSRFMRDRGGASAVEFAIVAPVFFALMFSTFEVGWFYFVNANVDAAATNAARMLRTGQVQKAEMTKESFFEDLVCPKVKLFGDCDSRLTVEVRTFNSFSDLASDATPLVCSDESTTVIDAIPYDPGADRSIVRVRICYMYDTLNPMIGMSLARNEQGQRKVSATYVLRVEPYSKGSTSAPNQS